MSNLFDTGSETVNRMCRLQFTGNVIPSTWYHTIKKETGKSAQEYIQLTTIDRAKELLIEGNMSVSEIAYELGFKYPHHLSRLFKKVVGVAPNEYRVTN